MTWTSNEPLPEHPAPPPPVGPAGGLGGRAATGSPEVEALRANLRTLANREAREVFAASRREGAELTATQTPADLPQPPRPTGHLTPPDLPTGHLTPPSRKSPTISDNFAGQATLELPAGGLPPVSPEGQATLELPPRSRPTWDEAGSGQATLEFGALGGVMPPPQAASDSGLTLQDTGRIVRDGTLAFEVAPVPGGAPLPPGSRTVGPEDATVGFTVPAVSDLHDRATVAPRELSSIELENMATMWAEGAALESNPRHTLKVRQESGATESSLVIRPRALSRPGEPVTSMTDYELKALLGEGGMGVVYTARQASIDRSVAVKMLKNELAAAREQREKFLAEAVITGDLDHPNIVPIYELGSNESGALFYSMKRVQGVPWLKVLREKSLTENLEILLKVADAVAFAHSRGVIHRDLKPDNVMLGDFGEVLVMDWGIAISTGESRLTGTIRQTSSMGGTPAYMAPEMATGPVDRIGPTSDVYLLGAILFEILTGRPPHTGRDVMACLFAAASNEIVPTDGGGELFEIALQALATDPAERFATVTEFQAAIRRYQSHQESVVLSERAGEELQKARRTNDYQDFARAVFAYEEAAALWDGNDSARDGAVTARLRYAESALAKADFDLAASLLDPSLLLHRPLAEQVRLAQRERDARLARLKFLRRVAVGLVAALFVIGAGAYFGIRQQRDRAVDAEQEARTQFNLAERAKGEAEVQRDAARQAETVATTERDRAQRAEVQARQDRDLAQMARENEAAQRRLREYQAYLAQIGLAAAKIDENGFGEARELLAGTQARLRNWEWGRLLHLCLQDERTITGSGPIDSLAVSPDGQRLATGSWQGLANVWDLATGQQLLQIRQGMHVHGVAFSPDGKLLATANNDPDGEIRLWDAATGALVSTFGGHDDSALSVVFSRDGQRLLSSSYDQTARLWDVASGTELRVFRGHTWWVWSAEFSPDENRVVTASQDGTVLVWNAETGEKGPPFTGHQGPVYCARFSPTGEVIASGGADKQVLVWDPAQVKPFDFRSLSAEGSSARISYRSLTGHTGAVRAVAFAPDGRRLASGGHDNSVKLWNLADDSLTITLRGHAGWVRSCAFTPDGARVVSAGHDQLAKLWNPATYAEVRVLRGHSEGLLDGAFSADGQWVVTGGRDRTARVWETATGKLVETLDEGHAFLLSTAQFLPDGKRLLTAAGDGTTRMWDRATGGELWRLEGTGRAGVAALSDDGQWLATGTADERVALWNASDGLPVATLSGHKAEATAAAFTPDGARLLTGDARGKLRLWDRATGQEVLRLDGHTEAVVAVAVLGADRALSASVDRTVAQWDLATGRELPQLVLRHPAAVTSLSQSPDREWAVTTCGDDTVRVWRLATAEPAQTWSVPDAKFTTASFSPDGTRVLALGGPAGLRLWDRASGQAIDAAGQPHDQSLLPPEALAGETWIAEFDPTGTALVTAGGSSAQLWDWPSLAPGGNFERNGAVAATAFTPDGSRVITGSWDGHVKLWDRASGRALAKLSGGGDAYVNGLAVAPDGRWIAAARDDDTVQLWDTTTNTLAATLVGHAGPVRAVVFFADGTRLASASSDKTIRIWELPSGKLLRELTGHTWGVTSLAVSGDGQRLISGGEDNSARVWRLDSDEAPLVLRGHTAGVTSVALAPDGLRVVTGSQDNTARLWDAETAQEVLTLAGHAEEITAVRFSPTGREVLTTSSDGTAIIWLSVDWRSMTPPAESRSPTALTLPASLR